MLGVLSVILGGSGCDMCYAMPRHATRHPNELRLFFSIIAAMGSADTETSGHPLLPSVA